MTGHLSALLRRFLRVWRRYIILGLLTYFTSLGGVKSKGKGTEYSSLQLASHYMPYDITQLCNDLM